MPFTEIINLGETEIGFPLYQHSEGYVGMSQGGSGVNFHQDLVAFHLFCHESVAMLHVARVGAQ